MLLMRRKLCEERNGMMLMRRRKLCEERNVVQLTFNVFIQLFVVIRN